jgi:16S rRNA (guanine527-N7)-methyltransferase
MSAHPPTARAGQIDETVSARLSTGEAASLAAGLARIGLALPASAAERLLAYVDLLAKWNRTNNLTAIREPARMITHHVLDALAILPQLPDRDALRLLDVGSGGGVPGIPIAIARPQWSVTLLDANRKKTTFLTQAAIELGAANVAVVTARVESFVPSAGFDVVVSRAFSDLADFAAGAARHLAHGGVLAAMKGVHPDEEIALMPPHFEVLATPAIPVPGLDAARHLVLMRPRASR